MGLKIPFKPSGTCSTCRFSEPIPEKDYRKRFHRLFCKRFPPVGPTRVSGDGPWSHEAVVLEEGYCGEWESEDV